MADSFWTNLLVGPYDQSKHDQVKAAIEQIADEWQYEGFDPETTHSDDGQVSVKLEIGHVKDGAGRMFSPEGSISSLIELGVPYVLYDEGHWGQRPGVDYSWHPEYGDTIRIGERNTQGDKVLPSHALSILSPRSNEELGKAVRAYFAEAGSEATKAGWSIWEEDYEAPSIKANRLMLAARSERREGAPTPPATDKEVAETLAAVAADEPAVHLLGGIDQGFTAFGPYESVDVAMDRHEPELEQILTVFDRSVRDEDQLTAEDIDEDHFGVIWVAGNLVDGFTARGIYRDVDAAVESNDGKDGFTVALIGPLQ